jgi:Sel1 repeat
MPYIGVLSIALTVAFCGLAGGIISWGRAFRPYDRAMENPPSLNEYLIADPRPPVLYLRPFQMESYDFSDAGGFEQFFCEALTKCGPFVALGNPHDYVPPLGGAVRLYASDTDWIQKLGELARQSSCIVVQTGRSGNLRVEYEYLRREGMQEKLFIFTGHPNWRRRGWLKIWREMVRFGTLRISWQDFSADLATLGYDLGFSDPGRGAVITFDVEGRGIVLTTQAKTAAEFVEPIRAWVERRNKIGRGIPTQCISCGQRHYVFPADTPVIRERWCPKCDLGLNVLERTVKRFWTGHTTGAALALGLPLVVVPLIVFGPLGILFVFLVEVPVFRFAGVWAKQRIWRRLMRLYERLAEAGDAVAMANLGLLRRNPPVGFLRKNPPITASDYSDAALWFRKSAEAGDICGMIQLADILARGSGGLDADANQAVYWYKRAAALGSRAAQQKLERSVLA